MSHLVWNSLFFSPCVFTKIKFVSYATRSVTLTPREFTSTLKAISVKSHLLCSAATAAAAACCLLLLLFLPLLLLVYMLPPRPRRTYICKLLMIMFVLHPPYIYRLVIIQLFRYTLSTREVVTTKTEKRKTRNKKKKNRSRKLNKNNEKKNSLIFYQLLAQTNIFWCFSFVLLL